MRQEFIVCAECRGTGERLKPYVSKAIIECCPECGGTGLREASHD